MGTWLKRIGLGALALVVLCTVVVFAVDAHVRSSAGPRIVSVDEAAALGDVDCVLVFGCGCIPTDAKRHAGGSRRVRRRAVREWHVAEAADERRSRTCPTTMR